MRKIDLKTETKTQRFEKAEKIAISISQRTSFQAELASLKSTAGVRNNSRILKLTPYIDENGLLRSESRIKTGIIKEFRTNPIILDGEERFLKLLIQHFHSQFFHMNREAVINEIRQSYVIIELRRALKHYLTLDWHFA